MAITVANANAYFEPDSHVQSRIWNMFSTEQKTAGIAQAKRVLARILLREVDETASTITQSTREDLATYEQALYMLRNSPAIVEGQDGVAGFLAQDHINPDEAAKMEAGEICPSARRFLTSARANGRPSAIIEFARG